MTKEQAVQWKPIIDELARGGKVQLRVWSASDSGWLSKWVDVDEVNTDVDRDEYRLKPEVRLRPWKLEEVPLGCWVRVIGNESRKHLLTYAGLDGICAGVQCENRTFMNLTGDMEHAFRWWLHSTDGGKTWKPCGVEE